MSANNIDEFMNFNNEDLTVFNEPESGNNQGDSNIYNTNPNKFSTAEDKHYRAKIRCLMNPFDKTNSIIKKTTYTLEDANGLFFADSKLSIPGKKNECPLFTSWKALHFSGDATKDEWSKQMFEKKETQWVTVQVIEDENRPELVGKFLAMKLPVSIWKQMDAKMHPSKESKKQPVAMLDFVFGPALNLDVVPGPKGFENRQISYDLCSFDDETSATPIIKVDGTALFTDEELETIDNYVAANSAVQKAKTEKARQAKQEEKEALLPEIKVIYQKAVDYMMENCINLQEIVGFKEWDERLTNRVNEWLKKVMAMKDPKVPELKVDETTGEPVPPTPENVILNEPENDLPF